MDDTTATSLRTAPRETADLTSLGLAAAAAAVRNGDITSEDYTAALLARASSRATHVLVIVVRDTGSMLMHAHDGGIDHLHGRIVSRRQAIHDPIPDACLSPANEAIVASGMRSIVLGQITPWRT